MSDAAGQVRPLNDLYGYSNRMISMTHIGDFKDSFSYKLPHLGRANQVAAGSLRDVPGAIT